MTRRLFNPGQLEALHNGVVRVLGEMGMKVENRQCLEALERSGAVIDYPQERASFPPEVIGRVLAAVQHDYADWERESPRLGPDMSIGGGGTCPFYFDDEQWRARRANEADCVEACKIVETSAVRASGVPVYNCDCAERFAPLRCLQIALETFAQTTCYGIDLFFPEQVPFVVELGRLYRNDPCWFLPAGNCPTSPLQIGKTVADLAAAKAPYKKHYAVPTMPIAGANAPITPVGTAVVGAAEILGGFILAKALNPETPVGAAALSAKMDMRTGNITYLAPEVFVADVAIAELCERYWQIPCATFGIYIDAKTPGRRALYERMMRSVGLGLYGGLSPMAGTLDQGKVFSATQLMLDGDMHTFLAEYTAAPVVSEETLAVQEIVDIGWNSSGYMIHEHTLQHMRDGWRPNIPGADLSGADPAGEREVLTAARQLWQQNLSGYEPPGHSAEFLRDLRGICARAEQALA